jgi:glutamyl-tRNA(Gln) amidotransferase subunit D
MVIEATGLGQVPTYGANSWIPAVKKAVGAGIVVCAAAQAIYGRLNPNVYAEGRMAREAGMVHLQDMLPETAYVKLGWVLGHTKSPEKAAEMMLLNHAGELSERSAVDSFLC